MQEKEYYKEIENIIETIEINAKVRALQDNSEKLKGYWEIGRLIVEAQGGKRAKYNIQLIKKWANHLSIKYGKNYNQRNLMFYRNFYLLYPKVNALRSQLTWTHYRSILPIKDENERNYYINLVIANHLSSRELMKEMKNKSFERLSYADKNNIPLITDKKDITIKDMIKDPILIKTDKEMNNIEEKALHKYLIAMLENRFLELGIGFALIGHEYKLIINKKTYKIDLLFFNVELNCYVAVELKTRKIVPKDLGQIEFYVSYIEQNLKKKNHNKTIGLLIVKEKDKYVIEYTTSNDIFVTTYKLTKEKIIT